MAGKRCRSEDTSITKSAAKDAIDSNNNNNNNSKKKKKKTKEQTIARQSFRIQHPVPRLHFPPVLYTNVEYHSNPCCFRVLRRQHSSDDTGGIELPCTLNDFNDPYVGRVHGGPPSQVYGPTLPYPCACDGVVVGDLDLDLWSPPWAAMQAAKHGSPGHMVRFLGCITRTVEADRPPPPRTNWPAEHGATLTPRTLGKPKSKRKTTATTSSSSSPPPTIPLLTLHKAKQHIKKQCYESQKRKQCNDQHQHQHQHQHEAHIEADIVEQRALEWMETWNSSAAYCSTPIPECTLASSGDVHAQVFSNDPHYIPLSLLLLLLLASSKTKNIETLGNWRVLKNSNQDLRKDHTTSDNNGGMDSEYDNDDDNDDDNDLPRILQSLAELQSPRGSLYQRPLLLAYPRMIPQESPDPKRTKDAVEDTTKPQHYYQLTIGVYAHRLLPEILVQHDLANVLRALDPESYYVHQPLARVPRAPQPVFASANYPKVVVAGVRGGMGASEWDQELEILSSSSSSPPPSDDPRTSLATSATEKTTSPTTDRTLEGSTQTEGNTISAFSTQGIMKLWENKGCDVTKWPMLHARLDNASFLPQLLLHQIHALCWMYDMEQLGGFGLNSLLWEERKWLDDGASYYWSPALGQLRLDRPPTMHGGLLCDEMGLGSTYVPVFFSKHCIPSGPNGVLTILCSSFF